MESTKVDIVLLKLQKVHPFSEFCFKTWHVPGLLNYFAKSAITFL